MNKTTLLILAAGMGSRYGGLKQMDEIGPNGETIMDYSVFDAIRAGFNKVVFVIREDFADAFKAQVSDKYQSITEVVHVYQSLDTGISDLPTPESRVKPWGTGHAVLCAADVIDEPFAVINADDFYGKDAFEQAQSFLSGLEDSKLAGMVGYKLSNTLSDHGHVNRGVCALDADHFLHRVTECEKIRRTAGGEIIYDGEQTQTALSDDTIVSMNFWMFHPEIFDEIAERFKSFLEASRLVEKSEFYIPKIVDELLTEDLMQVLVLLSGDTWYGVTYREDKPLVRDSIRQLHDAHIYPDVLNH